MRIFLLLCLSAPWCFGAANHYIRTGAAGTGDGANWTNAYASFAAAASAGYTRGDTYFVAGGTYAENVYINPTLSGVLVITVKKATVADHGTSTGWADSYGTTVATINGNVEINKGYIVFDGVTGGGPGSYKTGHGFKVYNAATTNVFALDYTATAGPTYEIAHVEIMGAGSGGSSSAYMGMIYNAVTSESKGAWVHHCWIHEVSTNGVAFLALVGTSYSDYGFLFENNCVTETGLCTNPANHGQGMQLGYATNLAYGIIRNNWFDNISGTAILAFLGGASNIAHANFRVYNNTFSISDYTNYQIVSPGPIWHEDIKGFSNLTLSNLEIENNVFYGIKTVTNLGQIVLEISTSGNVAKNNVWENCQFTANHTGITQTTNGYQTSGTGTNSGAGLAGASSGQVAGSSSTFTSASTYDFTLTSGGYGVATGTDLSATFTTYADGTTRTGTWNLGPLPVSAGPTASGSGISGLFRLTGSATIR